MNTFLSVNSGQSLAQNESFGNKQMMTTRELAETLGVSVETVRTVAKKVIDPSKNFWKVINGGKSQVFTEAQATNFSTLMS